MSLPSFFPIPAAAAAFFHRANVSWGLACIASRGALLLTVLTSLWRNNVGHVVGTFNYICSSTVCFFSEHKLDHNLGADWIHALDAPPQILTRDL